MDLPFENQTFSSNFGMVELNHIKSPISHMKGVTLLNYSGRLIPDFGGVIYEHLIAELPLSIMI